MRRAGGVFGAIVLCGAAALFLGVTLLPRTFGIEMRSVVSSSMEPAIGKGALVVTSPVAADAIRPGDVIMFHAPDGSGRVITHRVVGADGEGEARTLETRGDANDDTDPWAVSSRDVIGRVRGDIPKAGYVVEKVRSRTGFLVLMVIPALIVLLSEASVWRRFLRTRGGRVPATPGRAATLPATPYMYPVVQAADPPTHRPSPFLAAAAVMTLAVAGVASAVFALAPRPVATDDGARLAAETASIAKHSQALAAGEAFSGDIQLLRNADDPRLRDPATAPVDRETALRQMLLTLTNRFDALALVDLNGAVLATTDARFVVPTRGGAYARAIAEDSVAVSDIGAVADGSLVLDYATPVRDTEGRMHAIIVGRTTPERTWASTLAASIDGGRTLLADAEGHILAGSDAAAVVLPPDGASSPWTLDGVPSICAAAPIGAGTHLDHGWQVVSCLPSSLTPATSAFSMTRFLINTVAVALVAFSSALLLLAWLLGERRPRSDTSPASVGLKAIEARLVAQRELPHLR